MTNDLDALFQFSGKDEDKPEEQDMQAKVMEELNSHPTPPVEEPVEEKTEEIPQEPNKEELEASIKRMEEEEKEQEKAFEQAVLRSKEVNKEEVVQHKQPSKAQVFDINDIKISNMTGAAALKNITLLKARENQKTTGTSQTVAIKSGYKAHMQSLTFAETLALDNSSVDSRTYLERLYKIVYDKIYETSVGEFDFDTFLGITSLDDLEHLVYGIFSQTYKTDNTLNITCGKCETKSKISFEPNDLIRVDPKDQPEVFARMAEVLNSVTTVEELQEKSFIKDYRVIKLPESEVLYVLRYPTLENNLDLLKGGVAEQLEKEDITGALAGATLFIEKALVPVLSTIDGTPTGEYLEETDALKIFELLSLLSSVDGLELMSEITRLEEALQISYSLTGVVCPSCSNKMSDIPVNILEILFLVGQQRMTS